MHDIVFLLPLGWDGDGGGVGEFNVKHRLGLSIIAVAGASRATRSATSNHIGQHRITRQF